MEKINFMIQQIINFFNKIITKKTICFFMIIATIILLIPILRLSFYTFPSADDFDYGIKTINQNNVIDVIKGSISQVKNLTLFGREHILLYSYLVLIQQ